MPFINGFLSYALKTWCILLLIDNHSNLVTSYELLLAPGQKREKKYNTHQWAPLKIDFPATYSTQHVLPGSSRPCSWTSRTWFDMIHHVTMSQLEVPEELQAAAQYRLINSESLFPCIVLYSRLQAFTDMGPPHLFSGCLGFFCALKPECSVSRRELAFSEPGIQSSCSRKLRQVKRKLELAISLLSVRLSLVWFGWWSLKSSSLGGLLGSGCGSP